MKDRPPLSVLVLYQFCFFRRHKEPTKDLDPVWSINGADKGGDGGDRAGDFPASGCQMCDRAHPSAIRTTACGNLHWCLQSEEDNGREIWQRGPNHKRSIQEWYHGKRVWEKEINFCYSSAVHMCRPLSLNAPAEWLLEASVTGAHSTQGFQPSFYR